MHPLSRHYFYREPKLTITWVIMRKLLRITYATSTLPKGTEREAPAHYGLGWLYHRQGIYHWAAQSFEKAINGDDLTSRKALYYEAVNHKLSGNFQRAMDTFKEFGDRFKEGLWVENAYYEWGISAFEAGDYDGAITILLNLIRQQDSLSNGAQVYTLLGEIFYANNEYTSAITAFEQAETMGNVDPYLRRQAQFQKHGFYTVIKLLNRLNHSLKMYMPKPQIPNWVLKPYFGVLTVTIN